MIKLLQKMKKNEAGASLVEYAVALIVVTIVGAGGVIAIAGDASSLAGNAADVSAEAVVLVDAAME